MTDGVVNDRRCRRESILRPSRYLTTRKKINVEKLITLGTFSAEIPARASFFHS